MLPCLKHIWYRGVSWCLVAFLLLPNLEINNRLWAANYSLNGVKMSSFWVHWHNKLNCWNFPRMNCLSIVMKCRPLAHGCLCKLCIYSSRSSESPAYATANIIPRIWHEIFTGQMYVYLYLPLGGLDRWQPPMVQIYVAGWVELFHRRIFFPTDSFTSRKAKVYRTVLNQRVESI